MNTKAKHNYMMESRRLAIPLLRTYVKSKGYSEMPSKDNDLYRIYCTFENISTKGKKLRDIVLSEYRNGKLDAFKSTIPETTQLKEKKPTTAKKKSLFNTEPKPVDNFYKSTRWADLKKVVYNLYEFKCMKCGANNTEMHVDHILPVSKYPTKRWSLNNLQLLCKGCNMEKSNINETDYRTPDQIQLCSKYINGEI